MTARKRGAPKRQRADRAEEGPLLELLSHGLSEEEIQRVLACALLALDERGRDRLLANLGEETGGTLRRRASRESHTRASERKKPLVFGGDARIDIKASGNTENSARRAQGDSGSQRLMRTAEERAAS